MTGTNNDYTNRAAAPVVVNGLSRCCSSFHEPVRHLDLPPPLPRESQAAGAEHDDLERAQPPTAVIS